MEAANVAAQPVLGVVGDRVSGAQVEVGVDQDAGLAAQPVPGPAESQLLDAADTGGGGATMAVRLPVDEGVA